MYYVGIDIGSTASKVVVRGEKNYISFCQQDGAARRPVRSLKKN